MKLLKSIHAELAGLIALIVYLFTLAPTVVQIDSGELAAVQATLGIAHPTGYPLFTIIGYLFTLIPLPLSKISMSNLLSAMWVGLAVTTFIKSALLIISKKEIVMLGKNGKIKKARKKNSFENTAISNELLMTSAILGGLFLAFSKSFWMQSTSVEVYSLHLLLINLVIFFILKAYYSGIDESVIGIYWISTAIILALGFSNHMTTLLVIPGLAYIYFTRERFTQAAFRKIGIMLFIFLPILFVFYSYLPFRAAQDPILNWGNPVDFERIWRHFTGKQYQVWIFSSIDSAGKQFSYFITNLPQEFAYAGLIPAVVGVFGLFKLSRKIFAFVTILFLSTILYSINYDIVDIDSYFLLAYIAMAFCIVVGILNITLFLSRKGIAPKISMGLISILLIIQSYLNFGKVDHSKTFIYEDYTKSLINSVEENSVILSYQWDYFLSASYYFQFVENFRKDVVIIDKELLRRSWYYTQIENLYPDVMKNLKNDVSEFLKALKPFERSENFDANKLEMYYRKIMTGLVAENIDQRDFYLGPEIFENEMRSGQFRLPEGYYLVPHLHLFKVVKGNDYVEAPLPEFKYRDGYNPNKYAAFINQLTANMLANRAMYEIQFNKKDRALIYVNKIREMYPDYRITPQLLNGLD